MSKQNDGGAAFPVPDDASDIPGMSLRDWFAGQALAGLASDGERLNAVHEYGDDPAQAVALAAYAIADAMLRARGDE
jgi:hypothetical protein